MTYGRLAVDGTLVPEAVRGLSRGLQEKDIKQSYQSVRVAGYHD